MMLPRRSSFSRSLAIFTFFVLSVWIFIQSHGNRSPRSGIQEVIMSVPKVIGLSSKNLSLLEHRLSHRHSNQSASLEEFRKNMTLLHVNMSGIIDRIKQANDSNKKISFHGDEKHRNAINPHNFHYVLNAPKMCNTKKIFAIVYVHTAPSHYKRRMVIRQTWGNVLQYKDVNIRLIFVMGIVWEDKEAQKALEFESEQYHDIVQENFKDSYKNLTYKGIGALKWISKYCSQATFVIKTDDDIFVNMFTLLRHLRSMDKHGGINDQGLILCLVWYKMTVMRSGKWKVDKDQFKDDYYPVYCSGSAFTLTMNAALRMHEVSYHVPFFWVDDFYITGLLPLKAGNITHKQFMSTYVLNGGKLEERFTGPQWFTYIFSHVHNLNLIQSVWDRLVQLNRGQIAAKVKFALPGHLPDEKEIRRKEKEAEDKVKRERDAKKKKEQAAKKAKSKKEVAKKQEVKKKEQIQKKAQSKSQKNKNKAKS